MRLFQLLDSIFASEKLERDKKFTLGRNKDKQPLTALTQ